MKKRVPLAISRGTRTESEVVQVRWTEDGVEGWGESVPFDTGDHSVSCEQITASLDKLASWDHLSAWDRAKAESLLRQAQISSAVVSGVNQAMIDWMGRKVGQTAQRVLGISENPGPITSVTVGISEPDRAAHRVRQWLEVHPFRAFKVKLGSPAGIKADQAMFEAVLGAVPAGARVSVDANGGWNVDDALLMAKWLADRGLDHLEQPLRRGDEGNLPELFRQGALPIIVDESCYEAADIPRLAGSIHGINLKLMKCGGIDAALRLVHVARAHELKILVGCYGNSALGNTCAAALGPLVDYLDLDSHLNLESDPFHGARLEDGRLVMPAQPGFGVSHE